MEIETIPNSRMMTLQRYLPMLIAGVWICFFWVTFSDLWERWVQWDGALAHGIPVMIIFLSLLWKTDRWQRYHWLSPALETTLSSIGLLGTSLLWFLAYAVNIQIIEQLLLLPALIFAYAVVFGWKTVFHHRILLLFPIFAIPIWGSLNGILLDAASLVVGELVRLIEMPALIQGNSIYIPYGHILIADGCSGLRYFVIALTLAYLIAYLNGYREPKLLITLIVAAVLGLITNWIRIFILIVIGYNTQMESSLMGDHELFGWILFGVIALPVIYFAPVLRRSSVQSTEGKGVYPTSMVQVAVSMGAMVIGPLLGFLLYWSFAPSGAAGSVEVVTNQVSMPLDVVAPKGGETVIKRLSDNVLFREDIYHRNDFEEKLVPYLPRLYSNEVWLKKADESRSVGGHSLNYQTFSEKSGRKHMAQLQWFTVGSHVTANRVQAKLLQIRATLRGENVFSIITLQIECRDEGCSGAYQLLSRQAEYMLIQQD